MRATATLLVVAGLASTAFGAATKFFTDDKCNDEIGKKVFNGLSSGDAIIPDDAKFIKTDAILDTWFAYQSNDGKSCKGDLLTRMKDGECTPVDKLGIGCTRLCSGGLGGGDCAAQTL
ncbi:uncharacterized protein B0T15DRAFT_494269 [Chaetomium strumarium]|uniref:Uncharacterized protein n=1 Tax=Chaetomium strumarium TaxID=1170767 RepID=A0AAJ0GTZ7_9PEZI|nr:hypothetical protein B0T15DRAFT_494269 [Chaetomium strumarium]